MLARERRSLWANAGACSDAGAPTHVEKRSRSALPLPAVRCGILRVDLSKSYLVAPNAASRIGFRNAAGNETLLEVTSGAMDSVRMRRLPFEAVRVRPAASMAGNHLPTSSESLASGRRKRSFTLFSSEGLGNEGPVKKHKPFNLNSNCASGGEIKSKRSREMVGRKFRRLDSLEESGVVTGKSLRRTQSHQVCECEHGSGKWITGSSGVKEENRPDVLQVAVEVDSTGRTESRRSASRKRIGVHSSEPFSDDWTQEHLQEPRKIEKRRSLDELQAPLLSWARKAARSRCGVRTVKPGVETNSPVKAYETFEDDLILRKEELNPSVHSDEITLHVQLDEIKGGSEGYNHVGTNSLTRLQSVDDINYENADILVPPTNCLEQIQEYDREEIKGEADVEGDGSRCARDRQTDLTNAPELECPVFDGGKNLGEDHGARSLHEDQQVTCKSSRALSNGGKNLGEDHEARFLHEDQQVTCKSSRALSNGVSIESSFGAEGRLIKASFAGDESEMEPCPVPDNAIHQFQAEINVRRTVKVGISQDCSPVDAAHLEEASGLLEHEVKLSLAEGRKCGLCGGGSDGEPPESLLPVDTKYEEHANGGEKVYPLYSEWDAFSTEPGWLGPLLGPLSDRFGIAGVWVHQECAIWSPEVYFAGVGHMKNVRAALRRGRLLKCSRCSKPGATIGCRIDRCPHTYHLPCGRFDGCFFDHKKFLMACDEHLHLFLPRLPGRRHHRNSLNVERIRFKRTVAEWKKMAQKASLLDIEAEEKWLEKAGVDEEFLRRERRRLQRDLRRLAPVIIGGSGGNQRVEGWECTAGLENVVQCLKELVIMPLMYPEAFDGLGIVPPRGVLLHGHPGTGKTLAVRALVGALAKGSKQVAYFARRGADCLGKYVGDAERQLRLLFQQAEKHQPSLIFFDEIDGLAPTRSQHQDQTQKSVVSTLLALMDGIKSRGSVVVIGATNQPDALDPALRRPGRFDREVYFPLPSIAGRAAILTLLTRKWPMPPTHDIITLLASCTTGYAGADLQALCAQAAMISLRKAAPIEELLTIAEEEGVDRLPPPPKLTVSVMDWADALEKVSPPCSCRSAKAAVNVVPSAPLPSYMVTELLWPMLDIIITLHLDAQGALPPLLKNVVLKLDDMLKSGLRKESWMTCLRSLLHCRSSIYRKSLESDLENAFRMAGMILGSETTRQCEVNLPYGGSRFRIMISGDMISGHKYLAAWILYGFEGFVEMCNLSLATMLQEGGGDVIQGLIQILGNVRNICPCVIYMPQLETWALEPVERSLEGDQRQVSSSWSTFLQIVNSMPGNLQIAFVAYCNFRKDAIPLEIAKFFSLTRSGLGDCPSSAYWLHCNSLSNSETDRNLWPSSTSTPCSWVQLSSVPEMKTIFSRAAEDYAESLSARLVHCINRIKRAHVLQLRTPHKLGTPHTCYIENELYKKDDSEKTPVSCNAQSKEMGFHDVSAVLSQQVSLCDKQESERVTGSLKRESVPVLSPQQNLVSFAISMLGYQLLYHSQFKDLRHATSTLNDGPSFCTKKFDRSSLDGCNDCNSQIDKLDNSLLFQGLIAVGLSAYSGKYLKPREVAWEVRKVLELLMSRIDLKISLGKDPQQFSHLLSQAAFLDDKVFAWAHDLQRFEIASGTTEQPLEPMAPSMHRKGNKCFDAAIMGCSSRGKEVEESSHNQEPSQDNVTNVRESSACVTEFPVEDNSKVIGSLLYSSGYQRRAACRAHEGPAGMNELQGNCAGSDALGDTPQSSCSKRHLKSCTKTRFLAWKSCPDCLNLVKHRLLKLFTRFWRQRGSVFSLGAADDVIGTCSASISVALYRSVGILEQNIVEGAFQCSAMTKKQLCECMIKHRRRTGKFSSMADPVDNSDSVKPMWDLNAADLAALDHSISQNLSRLRIVCLCPLLQIISDLN